MLNETARPAAILLAGLLVLSGPVQAETAASAAALPRVAEMPGNAGTGDDGVRIRRGPGPSELATQVGPAGSRSGILFDASQPAAPEEVRTPVAVLPAPRAEGTTSTYLRRTRGPYVVVYIGDAPHKTRAQKKFKLRYPYRSGKRKDVDVHGLPSAHFASKNSPVGVTGRR